MLETESAKKNLLNEPLENHFKIPSLRALHELRMPHIARLSFLSCIMKEHMCTIEKRLLENILQQVYIKKRATFHVYEN